MKPLLEIHWIYLLIGFIIGLLMAVRGARDVSRHKQARREQVQAPVADISKPKTLKEKRNTWYTPELRFGYRFLVNGLALALGCAFLAVLKLTGI